MFLFSSHLLYEGSFALFSRSQFIFYLNLSSQVGHRDFDVEKRLRRDLKRTHALLGDAQLLLSTMEQTTQCQTPGTKEQLERLHCQVHAYDFVSKY